MLFVFIIRSHPVRQYSCKLIITHGRLCNTIQAAVVSYTNTDANFIKHEECVRYGWRNSLYLRGRKWWKEGENYVKLLYSQPSIKSMVKLRHGRQQHVARMAVIINACVQHRTWQKAVICKIHVLTEINNKMNHKEIWCEVMDWTHFEQEIRADSRLGRVMEIRK
jgi:hypothetical protein